MEVLGVPRPKPGCLEIETRDVQAETTGRQGMCDGKVRLENRELLLMEEILHQLIW